MAEPRTPVSTVALSASPARSTSLVTPAAGKERRSAFGWGDPVVRACGRAMVDMTMTVRAAAGG